MFLNKLDIRSRLGWVGFISITLLFALYMVISIKLLFLYEENHIEEELYEDTNELMMFGINRLETSDDHQPIIRELSAMYISHRISVRTYTKDKTLILTGLFMREKPEKQLMSASEGVKKVSYQNEPYFVLIYPYSVHGRAHILELWLPRAGLFEKSREWIAILLIAYVILLILVIPLIVWGSKKLTAPLLRIKESLSQKNSVSLSEKMDFYKGDDEISELIISINTLNSRVSRVVENLKTFSSQISHEVRTPLSLIIQKLEAIRNPELRNELKHDIHRITELIERLKVFHLIQESVLPLEESHINLSYLMTQSIQAVQSMFPNHHFDSHLDKISFDGDEVLLSMVFKNLLENACSYSTDNHITIQLTAQEIQIKNSCTEKDWLNIQHNFNQPSDLPASVHHIGLPLARLILKLHQLTLTATYSNGQALFSIQLPR